MADDVQRQLIILMLSNKDSEQDTDDTYTETLMSDQMPPRYTTEDIHARIAQAEKDILSGNTTPAIDMEVRLEKKYPWICK